MGTDAIIHQKADLLLYYIQYADQLLLNVCSGQWLPFTTMFIDEYVSSPMKTFAYVIKAWWSCGLILTDVSLNPSSWKK